MEKAVLLQLPSITYIPLFVDSDHSSQSVRSNTSEKHHRRGYYYHKHHHRGSPSQPNSNQSRGTTSDYHSDYPSRHQSRGTTSDYHSDYPSRHQSMGTTSDYNSESRHTFGTYLTSHSLSQPRNFPPLIRGREEESIILEALFGYLMHNDNCHIPHCPCNKVKSKFGHLRSGATNDVQSATGRVEGGDSTRMEVDPRERRRHMRLNLSSVEDYRPGYHPHFHTIRQTRRRRSKTLALTPIQTDAKSSPANTPPRNTTAPVLLREISLSADNLPVLPPTLTQHEVYQQQPDFHHPNSSYGSDTSSASQSSSTHTRMESEALKQRGEGFCRNCPEMTLITTLTDCTSEGIQFSDEANDFSLEIPNGAIPEEETLTVDVGVALFGPYQFPPGLRPVSPMFWVCVRDKNNFKFSKPVTVTLPHFLDLENDSDIQSLGLTFLKADHSTNPEEMYEFRPINGEMTFTPTREVRCSSNNSLLLSLYRQ